MAARKTASKSPGDAGRPPGVEGLRCKLTHYLSGVVLVGGHGLVRNGGELVNAILPGACELAPGGSSQAVSPGSDYTCPTFQFIRAFRAMPDLGHFFPDLNGLPAMTMPWGEDVSVCNATQF